MPFPYEDIRTFIDECEEEGMLIKVKKEVDWNLEAGAIANAIYDAVGVRVTELPISQENVLQGLSRVRKTH